MGGYWGDRAATAGACTSDGWLRTGDLGCLDAEGRLHFIGRQADVIKTGGENVHASEVRSALCALPGVRDAVVVGTPHPRWGSEVAALLEGMPAGLPAGAAASVQPGDGGAAVILDGGGGAAVRLDDAQTAHVRDALERGGLTRYKAPRRLACLAKLPRTAMGKVPRSAALHVLQATDTPTALRSRL